VKAEGEMGRRRILGPEGNGGREGFGKGRVERGKVWLVRVAPVHT